MDYLLLFPSQHRAHVRRVVVEVTFTLCLAVANMVRQTLSLSPFTVSIWSGECEILSFVLLFRSGQADIRLFGKLFIRCCEYGQVDIELFSFAVANMVRRMLNSLSLSPFVSLFRSGQANIGLSSFTVSIWSGECWTFFSFVPSLRLWSGGH
ncbi:hypothetical protein KFK09_007507 [Dendrobium nobile]|uniref:Uncharacterized protein n=1 Tax=Dendrobium nobile TaxID=94219 RepID=A0A8T3BS11_DENNO|nr:hypothetical protein KFK09_007507 [Dendrobium nobile]